MPVSMNGRKHQDGSALIIVAVLLIFAGFVLTLGLGPFHTTDNQDKIQRTAKRQQFLIHELSAYVQRENKLPCPADPSLNRLANIGFGFSINTSAPNTWQTDPNNPGVCDATPEGIIPFRTLGLASYDALDGWGHPFTYRISPVFNNPGSGPIFMRCRRFPWFYDWTDAAANPYPYNTLNVYPTKALFCCPPDNYPTGSDVVVYKSTGGPLAGPYQRSTFETGNDAPVDQMTNPALEPLPGATPETQEAFAFVIVSHGANAAGSYVLGTATRLGGTMGTDEATNAGQGPTPQSFVDHPMVLAPGANYFDDMVVWRTQIGIMGELNNGSCYAPFN